MSKNDPRMSDEENLILAHGETIALAIRIDEFCEERERIMRSFHQVMLDLVKETDMLLEHHKLSWTKSDNLAAAREGLGYAAGALSIKLKTIAAKKVSKI